MRTEHHKAFEKLIRQASQRHHTWQVFADFCEMAALALANSVTLGPLHDKRKARYLDIVRDYQPDEVEAIAKLLGVVTLALEEDARDFLGEMFMELELFNQHRGQYFTGSDVCRLMAEMTLRDGALQHAVQERGFVTTQEPACGAGAMIIAVATAMQAQHINYQQCLHVTAVDVDSTAAHMAYIQLSLLHIPAVVKIGNTLSLEVRDQFYTPAHVLGFWDNKLRRGYALGSKADLAAQPKPEPLDLSKLRQADLFGEVAA